MKAMFEDLARVSDVFLEQELEHVNDLVQGCLSEMHLNTLNENDLHWWIWLLHTVLDDLVEKLPLDRRREIIEAGMGVTATNIPVEAIAARSDARIDMAAAALRLRVAEGKVGGLLGEDLMGSITEALTSNITSFVQDLDTAMSMYDRLFMQEIANSQEENHWVYEGPLDKKNRAFCRNIMLAKEVYTDAGVEELNNHPDLHSYVPPNVKTLCGGYGCRHMFVPVTSKGERK